MVKKSRKNGPLWTKKNIKIDSRERFQGSLLYLPYNYMPRTKKSPEFILEGLNVNFFLHKNGFPNGLKFTILYTVKTKRTLK